MKSTITDTVTGEQVESYSVSLFALQVIHAYNELKKPVASYLPMFAYKHFPELREIPVAILSEIIESFCACPILPVQEEEEEQEQEELI